MTQEEAKTLLRRVKAQYGDRFIAVTQDVFDVWFDCLQDLDFARAKSSVDAHAKKSEYPPTIADIRRGAETQAEIETDLQRRVMEIYQAIAYPWKSEEDQAVFMGLINKLPDGSKTAAAEWLRIRAKRELEEAEEEGREPLALKMLWQKEVAR